jgi:hypothetical protein
MTAKKLSKSQSHYARNAALGNTVRFSLDMNCYYLTPEDRARVPDLSPIKTTIRGGTLTPEAAREIMKIILKSDQDFSEKREKAEQKQPEPQPEPG